MTRSISSKLRTQVLREAGGRCSCDPTRHIDNVTVGVGELEIHHIVPWRFVRRHEQSNLIALCRSCHVRADRGIISQWALQQLKRVSALRTHGDDEHENVVRLLLQEYLSRSGRVLGEGYYSAAAFVEFSRRRELTFAGQVAFADRIQTTYKWDPALLVASLYLELDLNLQAVRVLRLCKDSTRRTTRYMRTLGNAWSRAGRHDLGHRWFGRAASAGDRSVGLRCNWGDCMIYIGQAAGRTTARESWLERALNVFEQVRKEDPAVLFNKGRVFAQLGRKQLAEACFWRVTQIGTQYPLPHLELAFLYATDGRQSQALELFDEAIRRRPRRLGFLLDAASLALKVGDRARCRQYLKMFEHDERYCGPDEVREYVGLRKKLGIPTTSVSRQLTSRCM